MVKADGIAWSPFGSRRRPLLAALALLACLLGEGCAALTNPVAEGIPARRVPEELLAAPKGGLCSIPLNLLGQTKPAAYRLDVGDVLAVFVEGILGNPNVPLQANISPLIQDPNLRTLRSSIGYPVQVEADGTINLPLVGSLPVAGLTIAEARDAIRELYVNRQLLKRDTDRVMVSLLQPRVYQVMVFRQEGSSFTQVNTGVIPANKRGTGFTLELPAYENDVLHALLRSGGLPGLDACNEVLIHRNALVPSSHGPNFERAGQVVRIPLRLPHEAKLPIRPEDILLGPGDVVYLEARDQEVFYTGGLLPPGQYQLPRDVDLDVVSAISYVRGPLINGSFAVSNLSGALIQPGIGNPNPTRVTILRRTPDGGQVPIIVDLAAAMCDPGERILIKGGDLLVLQETPGEAMTRYFTQTFFNFNLVWQVIHDKFITGIVNVATPDRINAQVPTININQGP